MKKFKILAFSVLFCFLFVSSAAAWSFTLINKTPAWIDIEMYGEHLFWRDKVDKKCTANAGQEVACSLDGGICPYKVVLTFYRYKSGNQGENKRYTVIVGKGIATCWDQKYKAVEAVGSTWDDPYEFVEQ